MSHPGEPVLPDIAARTAEGRVDARVDLRKDARDDGRTDGRTAMRAEPLLPAGDASFDTSGATPPPRRPGDNGATGALHREDIPYLHDLNEALLAQATPKSTAVLYLMLVVVIVAIGWSAVATVEEVTKADARVIPAGREQVISSLEGGILGQMMVAEGALVEKDQPLLRLDPTRTRSSYREGVSRSLALKGSIARLRAEASGDSPVYPADVAAVTKIVRDEDAAFAARRRTLVESQASLRRNLSLLNGEIESAQRLLRKGLYSKVELGRLQRQANEIQMQIDERQNRFRAEANSELVRLESEVAQLKENLDARLDVFQRTTIKSPIRGVVKNIRAGTIGGTVPPGSPIMEIIPLDGDVLLEARLKPADVAFVRVGAPATIKITAFDPSVFGELKGVVQLIGPDTMRDDPRTQQQPETAYYRMTVSSERPTVHAGSKELPITPGMTGTVEVRTGEKTVLDYVLKPMFKAKEALRER